jgi:hypothetical protein
LKTVVVGAFGPLAAVTPITTTPPTAASSVARTI